MFPTPCLVDFILTLGNNLVVSHIISPGAAPQGYILFLESVFVLLVNSMCENRVSWVTVRGLGTWWERTLMTAGTLYMMEISRKLQGRNELHFHPLVGKRKNELSLNFGEHL